MEMATKIVDITPHHGAMTKAGSANFARFCDAASEFVDNSLQAYLDTGLLSTTRPDAKLVELSLFLNQIKMTHDKFNDSNSYMVIADKGCGMDEEKLKNFATYSLDKETRKENDEFISKFGVGAKQSGFYLGENLHVLTSSKKDSDKVLEMKLDANVFEERYQQNEKVFEAKINTRDVSQQNGSFNVGECVAGYNLKGDYNSFYSNPSLSKSMIEYIRDFETTHGDHFTVIVIKLKEKIVRSLLDNDRYTELPYDFGHIYHFYLHPEHLPHNIVKEKRFEHKLKGTASNANASSYILNKVREEPMVRGVDRKEDIEETLKVPFHFKLKIYKGDGLLYDDSIGKVNDDISQYINSAKAVFRMNMDFVDPEQQSKSKHQSQIEQPAEKATVQCIFFYYPYNHGETRPVISNYNSSHDAFLRERGEDSDSDMDQVGAKENQSKDNKRKADSTSNSGYKPLELISLSSKGLNKEKLSKSKSKKFKEGNNDFDFDDSDMDIAKEESTSLGKMSPAGSSSSNISPASSRLSGSFGDDGGLDLTDDLPDINDARREENEDKFHEDPAPECEIFWVNRCVPESSVKSFPFWPKGLNSRAECEKVGIAFHWRKRIKGYMFFDHKWNHISNNKLKVQVDPNLDHYLNERLAAQDIAYKPTNTPVYFKDWLKECHKEFDQENRYSLRLDKVETVAKILIGNPPPNSSLKGKSGFNSALFRTLETGVGASANEYTVGDKVMLFIGQQQFPSGSAAPSKKGSKITKKKYILAEIVGFDVDDTLVSADQPSFCGKGYIRYLRLPLEVFHPQYAESHSDNVLKPMQDSCGLLRGNVSQDLWENRDKDHDVRIVECLLENERVPLAALDDTKKIDNRVHAQKNVINEIKSIKEKAPKYLELYLFEQCGKTPSKFNNREVKVTVGTKYFKIGALILNHKSDLCVFRPECTKAHAQRLMYAVHLTLKDANGEEVLYDYKTTNDWYEASFTDVAKDVRVDTNELWQRTSTTEKSKQKTSRSSDKANSCMLSFYGAKAGGRSSMAAEHNQPNLSFERVGNFVLHAEVLDPTSKFPMLSIETKISVVSPPVSDFRLELHHQNSTLQMGGFLPPFTIALVDDADKVVKDYEGRLKLKITCDLDIDVVATLNPEETGSLYDKYQDSHRVYELLKETDGLAPDYPLYPIEGAEDAGELNLNEYSFLCVPRPGYKSTLGDIDDTLQAKFTVEVLLFDDNNDMNGTGHILTGGSSTQGTQPMDNGDNYTIVLGREKIIETTFGAGTPFDLQRIDQQGDIVSTPLVLQSGDDVPDLDLYCVDRWGGRCGPPRGAERWEVALADRNYIHPRSNVSDWALNNRGEVTVSNLLAKPDQSKFRNGELRTELSLQLTVSKVSRNSKSKSKLSAWKVTGIPIIVKPKQYPVRLELRYNESILEGDVKPSVDGDGESLESMDVIEGDDIPRFSAGDVLTNISYHLFDNDDKEVMLGDALEWIKKKDNGFYCFSNMTPESNSRKHWSSRPKVYKTLSAQSQGLPDITLPKFVGKFEFSVTLELTNNVTLKSKSFSIETKPDVACKWECILGGDKSSDGDSTDVRLLSGEREDAYDTLTAIVLRDKNGQYVSWNKDIHSKPYIKLFRNQKQANLYKSKLTASESREKSDADGVDVMHSEGEDEEDSEIAESGRENSKKRRTSNSKSKKAHKQAAGAAMVTLSPTVTATGVPDNEDGEDEEINNFIPVVLGCLVVHRNEHDQEIKYERITLSDLNNPQTSDETRDHFTKRGIRCWLIDINEVDIFAYKAVPEDVWIIASSYNMPYIEEESQEQSSIALPSKRSFDMAQMFASHQKELQSSNIYFDFRKVSIQAGYMRQLCLKEVVDAEDGEEVDSAFDGEFRTEISLNINRFTKKVVRVHICDAHGYLANLAYPTLKKGKAMTLRVFKMANDEYSEETASYINTSASMITDALEDGFSGSQEVIAAKHSLKGCKMSRNAEDGDIDVFKMKKVKDNAFDVELDFNTPELAEHLASMTTEALQSNSSKNSNQLLQFRLAMQLSFQLTDNDRQMLPLSYIHCNLLRMNVVTTLRVNYVSMLETNGTQMDLESGQEEEEICLVPGKGVTIQYDEVLPVLRVRAITDEQTNYTPSGEQQWVVVTVNCCDIPEVKDKGKRKSSSLNSSNPQQSLSPITNVYQQQLVPGGEYAEFVPCINSTWHTSSSSTSQRLPVGVYAVTIKYLETRPSLLEHIGNDTGVSLQFKLRVQPCGADKIVLSEESALKFVHAAASNYCSTNGRSSDSNIIVQDTITVECRDKYNNRASFNNISSNKIQGEWAADDIYFTVKLIELCDTNVENRNNDSLADTTDLPELIGQDERGYLHGKLDRDRNSYSITSLELKEGVGGGVSRMIGLKFEAFVKDEDGDMLHVLDSCEHSFHFTANAEHASNLKKLQEDIRALKGIFEPYFEEERHLTEQLNESEESLNMLITATKKKEAFKSIVNEPWDAEKREKLTLNLRQKLDNMNAEHPRPAQSPRIVDEAITGQYTDIRGRVVDLGYCNNDRTARILSRACGSKMGAIVCQSQETATSLYRKDRVAAWSLETMSHYEHHARGEPSRSRSKQEMLQGRLNLPAFWKRGEEAANGNPEYLVNLIQLPSDNEYLRDTVFYNMFGTAILFDDLETLMAYRKECITRKRRTSHAYTRSGDFVPRDGFLDPRNKINLEAQPSNRDFVFGAMPVAHTADYKRLNDGKRP